MLFLPRGQAIEEALLAGDLVNESPLAVIGHYSAQGRARHRVRGEEVAGAGGVPG